VIKQELNAATDNPLIFEPADALSGGNFHGEPVGLAMDTLAIAAAELGAISERRVYRLTDPALNSGLPAMLVDSEIAGGLNSGLMMPQYTAASLVLENRTLATPDTINSLPTSGGQEDFNANAMTAARHALQITENTAYVLAVEIYTASRALYQRIRMDPDLKPGKGTRGAYELLSEVLPYHPSDTLWGAQIEIVKNLMQSGKLLDAAGISA
jgi:histidine ammonia-lyase